MANAWLNEPDSHSFVYLGYRAFLLRTEYLMTWAGFVAIPEGHAARGQHDIWSPVWKDLSVHGGITFADFANENHLKTFPDDEVSPDDFLIGFDTAHSFDIIPVFETPSFFDSMTYKLPNKLFDRRTYKDLSYCIDQLKLLIEQLDAIQKRSISPSGPVSKTPLFRL